MGVVSSESRGYLERKLPGSLESMEYPYQRGEPGIIDQDLMQVYLRVVYVP